MRLMAKIAAIALPRTLFSSIGGCTIASLAGHRRRLKALHGAARRLIDFTRRGVRWARRAWRSMAPRRSTAGTTKTKTTTQPAGPRAPPCRSRPACGRRGGATAHAPRTSGAGDAAGARARGHGRLLLLPCFRRRAARRGASGAAGRGRAKAARGGVAG